MERKKREKERMRALEARGITEGGAVEACRNLRREDRGGRDALTPAGMPAAVGTAPGDAVAVYRHDDGGGESVFFVNGRRLYVMTGGVPRQLAVLPEKPAAVTVAPGRVVVMAGGGRPYMARLTTSGWRWDGQMPRLPLPCVVARGAGTLTQPMPARRLSTAYDTASARLDTADCDRVSADYLAAYERLNARARAAGAYIQPVMARVSLRSREGDLLCRSAPTLLAAPVDDALNCLEAVRTVDNEGEGYNRLAAGTLTAATYRAEVVWPRLDAEERAAWERWVGSVEVELSPQFHPADPDSWCDNRLTRQATNRLSLTLRLPGTSLTTSTQASLRGRILGSLSGLDSLMERGYAVAAGSGCDWTAIMAGHPTAFRAAASTTRGERRLTDSVKADRGILDATAFSAAAAGVCGDMAVWGDVSLEAVPAWNPCEHAASTVGGSWSGWTHLCFDDDEGAAPGVVGEFGDTAGRPAAFSPLIYVADPRARRLRVCIDGRRAEVALTPTADGRGACWLSDDLCPLECAEDAAGEGAPEVADPAPRRFPGLLLAAPADRPLAPTASATIAGAAVEAVMPAARGVSSWDFGRAMCYAATDSGLHAIALNSARTRATTSLVGPWRPVTPRAWTLSGRGLLIATAGGIAAVRGQVAQTLLRGAEAVMLGWDAVRDELWTLSPRGAVRVYNMTTLEWFDSGLTVRSLYSADGRLYVSDGFNIMEAGEESVPEGGIAVEWRARAVTGLDERLRRLSVDVYGTGLSLTATLTAGGGGAAGQGGPAVARLAVEGDVGAPLTLRAASPRRRALTLEIKGVAGADFMFCGAGIWTRRS